ncbi:hypothetical protein PABY_19670 [Pyrodictium abyssi]|uniref:Uncharacterized protein n=1 Tax=Pyrodictium abyssi TaxID=54256 RepID=A0ABN6ZU91_9CREN|nr:hypothetical protein PABY_19670 [Pyrodictium abyssi]
MARGASQADRDPGDGYGGSGAGLAPGGVASYPGMVLLLLFPCLPPLWLLARVWGLVSGVGPPLGLLLYDFYAW